MHDLFEWRSILLTDEWWHLATSQMAKLIHDWHTSEPIACAGHSVIDRLFRFFFLLRIVGGGFHQSIDQSIVCEISGAIFVSTWQIGQWYIRTEAKTRNPCRYVIRVDGCHLIYRQWFFLPHSMSQLGKCICENKMRVFDVSTQFILSPIMAILWMFRT